MSNQSGTSKGTSKRPHLSTLGSKNTNNKSMWKSLETETLKMNGIKAVVVTATARVLNLAITKIAGKNYGMQTSPAGMGKLLIASFAGLTAHDAANKKWKFNVKTTTTK